MARNKGCLAIAKLRSAIKLGRVSVCWVRINGVQLQPPPIPMSKIAMYELWAVFHPAICIFYPFNAPREIACKTLGG